VVRKNQIGDAHRDGIGRCLLRNGSRVVAVCEDHDGRVLGRRVDDVIDVAPDLAIVSDEAAQAE
jgi:hypothetical protein